jgi:hypothetical protein
MKLYRYYFLPSKDDSERKYSLYAITNKKKLAKEFENTRNMSRFMKKVSEVDNEEYVNFANEHREMVLQQESLTTRKTYDNGLIGHTDVNVTCTFGEYQIIKDCAEESATSSREEYWAMARPFSIYSKKIKAALKILEYPVCYKFYRVEYDPKFDSIEDDYSAPDFWIDELGAFIFLNRDTF